MADLVIRPYQPGDEEGIVACYNRIFPTADGAIAARTMEHWRWLFLQNPVGAIHVMVAHDAGSGVVGAYPCQPLRVWSEGGQRLAAQVVDLMVLPEFRRKGPRPGLFVSLGRRYYEAWCGPGPGEEFFHYGWPVPAWRMGQRYLDYQAIRDWDFLFCAPRVARAVPGDLAVTRVAEFAADVDELFDRLKVDMNLVLVRDSAYLNWRFARCPYRSYQLLECRERETGRLRGVTVYGTGDFLRPGTAFLVDWLAAPEDMDATVALLGTAEGLAIEAGAEVLATLFNQVDPRFVRFQDLGYRVRGTTYFTVVASFEKETDFFREHWYYTMGDSDLI